MKLSESTKLILLQRIAREGLVIKHAIDWCNNYEFEIDKTVNQLFEEYSLASPHPSLTYGLEIVVRAWWTNPKGTTCRCRVIGKPFLDTPFRTGECPETWYIGIEVQPLEGNNHVRYIEVKDIIRD